MSRSRRESDASVIAAYRLTLENTISQEEVQQALDEMGYDDKLINEGKDLFDDACECYDDSTQKKRERKDAYGEFTMLRDKLKALYSLDRKKAKTVFNHDSLSMKRLNIDKPIPVSYDEWITGIKKFYSKLKYSKKLQEQVSVRKITPRGIEAGLDLVDKIEIARNDYLEIKTASEEATRKKDEILLQLDQWMSDFYAVARLALMSDPDLMESIGIKTKKKKTAAGKRKTERSKRKRKAS
jgi:hypothetical protein